MTLLLLFHSQAVLVMAPPTGMPFVGVQRRPSRVMIKPIQKARQRDVTVQRQQDQFQLAISILSTLSFAVALRLRAKLFLRLALHLSSKFPLKLGFEGKQSDRFLFPVRFFTNDLLVLGASNSQTENIWLSVTNKRREILRWLSSL